MLLSLEMSFKAQDRDTKASHQFRQFIHRHFKPRQVATARPGKTLQHHTQVQHAPPPTSLLCLSSVLAVDSNINSNNEASLKKQPATQASYMQIAWRSPPVKLQCCISRHQGYWPQASRRFAYQSTSSTTEDAPTVVSLTLLTIWRERSAMWVATNAMRARAHPMCRGAGSCLGLLLEQMLQFG
jgi:hypothetical protein